MQVIDSLAGQSSEMDETLPEGQLRTSSYVIYVHLPEPEDGVLLIHGYTGAYDRVSRDIAAYLRSKESRPSHKPLYGEWSQEQPLQEAPELSERTTEILRKRGYLTHWTPAGEQKAFSRLARTLHASASASMPHYMIMPTYQCNLRCFYCFQDHMRTDPGYQHLLKIMTPEIADRIFAAMQSIERTHNVPENSELPRTFTFFGGEPLLEATLPIVSYIIDKALALGKAQFAAITNATELHHYIRAGLLGPGKIDSLQITIDGPPEAHNSRRIYVDGSGSFERIAENIDLALAQDTYISVRVNIDRSNLEYLPALANEIVARGWDQHEKFRTYAAAVTIGSDRTDRKSLLNSWQLNKALSHLRERHPNMRAIGSNDDSLTLNIRKIFEQSLSAKSQLSANFCGAHSRLYIIDPFADLYACTELTGDKKQRIGCIGADGKVVFDQKLSSEWRSRNVTTNPICGSCRYALYCGGGCALLAMHQNNTMYSNYCDGFQNRFRDSVVKAYQSYAAGKATTARCAQTCED